MLVTSWGVHHVSLRLELYRLDIVTYPWRAQRFQFLSIFREEVRHLRNVWTGECSWEWITLHCRMLLGICFHWNLDIVVDISPFYIGFVWPIQSLLVFILFTNCAAPLFERLWNWMSFDAMIESLRMCSVKYLPENKWSNMNLFGLDHGIQWSLMIVL